MFQLQRMALAEVLAWNATGLFQAIEARYLIGTYMRLYSRILGRYVGLRRRDPEFLQALDVVRPP